MSKADAQITYGVLAIMGAFALALAISARHPEMILLCGLCLGYCLARATS